MHFIFICTFFLERKHLDSSRCIYLFLFCLPMSEFEPNVIPWRNPEDEEEDLLIFPLESSENGNKVNENLMNSNRRGKGKETKVEERVIVCLRKSHSSPGQLQDNLIGNSNVISQSHPQTSCRYLVIGIGSAANFFYGQTDFIKEENYLGFITTNKISFKANTLSPTNYRNKGCHLFRVPDSGDIYALSYDNISDTIVADWCFQLLNNIFVNESVLVLDVLRFGQLKTAHLHEFEEDLRLCRPPIRYLSTSEGKSPLPSQSKKDMNHYKLLEEANLIGGISGGIVSCCEVMGRKATALFGFCSLRATSKDHFLVYQSLRSAIAWLTVDDIDLAFGQEEKKKMEKNLRFECDIYNHTASSIYT